MAFISAVTGTDASKKFMEVLRNDFKTLSVETKKKYPQIRESCDEAIEKLSVAANNPQASLYGVINQILYPLVQGCESKDIKIIKFCLGTIQRLIAHQAIDTKGARHVVDCLSALGQSSVLELKLLQTAALLMTTSDLVHGETLARTLVLCLRLEAPLESREASTCHAAAATVRQLVSLVFERAVAESDLPEPFGNPRPVKVVSDLRPCAADAYLIFQDIIQLVNGDEPHWLIGITELSKTFGLELLETVLTDFSEIFFKIQEFRFLLKEHVCALIIRLFSPNVKYRGALVAAHIPGPTSSTQGPERPHFPISMRLLRLVSVIIHKYHDILVTECEIFLSLTIKFLDPDKPLWQRSLALEVLHRMTIRPELLMSFCECYDLKPHTTNILQDIVNSLGAYVQSLFGAAQINAPHGLPMSCPQQAGFYWKGVWLPLCVTFDPGSSKAIYLEMLDRTEAPSVQEGYGISVAYGCLADIVRSIAVMVEGPKYMELYESNDCLEQTNGEKDLERKNNEKNAIIENIESDDSNRELIILEDKETTERKRTLNLQLVKSCWCGLVWGMSILAEASVGELERVLTGIQTLARVSGKVGHAIGRDACVSALCRAALPAHYCLPALGTLACPWRGTPTAPGTLMTQSSVAHTAPPDPEFRNQVVAVGTPLPCASSPVGQQQSFVMVTARHVTAMRALLTTAQRDGATIQQAWLPVLTTLQHLVWILGLKPSTGGSLKASRVSADSNSVMSTSSVMADLPALSVMLSKVFESSKDLDDVALHHLIDALCKLSNEAMELAYSNREPSLFAVAKLLETGLANLHRVEVMWRPLTNHLLEVCQHPHIRMREWGVEAITYLVQAALQYQHKHPQPSRERLLLEPLSELSGVRHADVRARQLECAARLLHSSGDSLADGWPLMLNIVQAINDHHSEQLVRSAFQCVQLIAADLLGAAGASRLRRVIHAAAAFAHQTADLNISLTAVGLMWNISDYLYHNREKLSAALEGEPSAFPELPDQRDLPHADKLWMCLYIRLGELCTEPRAPVRRAASQTLFSCVGAHGSLLGPPAWRCLLWTVLFPMLHKVQNLSNSASPDKVDTGDHILIHHTRNTAQKQWAETQVLTLSGVARVFHTRHQLLHSLGDFSRVWTALLDFITDFALRKSHEVSVASLKSFQEALTAAGRPPGPLPESGTLHKQTWQAAWSAWAKIANGVLYGTEDFLEANCQDVHEGPFLPSQAFLTSLLQIFPVIFQNVRSSFKPQDVETLCQCLLGVSSNASAGTNASLSDGIMSPSGEALLLTAIMHCMDIVQKEAVNRHELLVPTFNALLSLGESTNQSTDGSPTVGPGSLGAAVRLYRCTASADVVLQAEILHQIMACLHMAAVATPDCQRSQRTTQDQSLQPPFLLLQLLATGLPLATHSPQSYPRFWDNLPTVLEYFMFDNRSSSEQTARELALVVRGCVVGQDGQTSSSLPPGVASRCAALLRKGSLLTAITDDNAKTEDEAELQSREDFARTCFETLLEFSMMDNGSVSQKDTSENHLEVSSLLDRFQEVIKKYRSQIESDRAGKSQEVSRQRLSEMSFVLKAVSTLIDSMKKAPKGKVDTRAWDKVIGLYPDLVFCSCLQEGPVGPAVSEVLLHYSDLLRPPL